MAGRILIRRGNFADLPDLAEGELGYVEDRGTVYIGTSTDYNILLNPVAVNVDGYSLDGYLYPHVDNAHGLGTPDKRWTHLSLGPNSLHISSRTTDSGFSADNDYKIGIDAATGKLQISGNGVVMLEGDPEGGISGITSETDFQSFKTFQNSTNHSIIQSLDGYALLVDFNSFKSFQNSTNHALTQAADGYAASITTNTNTISSHYTQQTQADHAILQSLDGYVPYTGATTDLNLGSHAITALSITTTGADNLLGKTRIYNADGNIEINVTGTGNRSSYIDFHSDDTNTDFSTRLIRNPGVNGDFTIQQAGTGGVSIVNDLSVAGGIVNTALKTALDGYQTSITTNTNTISSHYTQQTQADHAILQSLDGYQSEINTKTNDIDFQDFKTFQNSTNHAIVQSLDGYALENDSATVEDLNATGDGYVAFFTGVGNNIAGDNDLFWDRANNQLGVTGGLKLGAGSKITEKSDGVLLLTNAADTTGITLQLLGDGSLSIGTISGSLSSSVVRASVFSTWTDDTALYPGFGVLFGSGSGLQWKNASIWGSGSSDVSLSRFTSSTLGLGNGTYGDTSGSLVLGNVVTDGYVTAPQFRFGTTTADPFFKQIDSSTVGLRWANDGAYAILGLYQVSLAEKVAFNNGGGTTAGILGISAIGADPNQYLTIDLSVPRTLALRNIDGNFITTFAGELDSYGGMKVLSGNLLVKTPGGHTITDQGANGIEICPFNRTTLTVQDIAGGFYVKAYVSSFAFDDGNGSPNTTMEMPNDGVGGYYYGYMKVMDRNGGTPANGTILARQNMPITYTAIDYSVTNRDAVIVVTDTSVARTVTLIDLSVASSGMGATGIKDGDILYVKDGSGAAVTNNITISGNGFNIDGVSTKTISTNWGQVQLQAVTIGGTRQWISL